MLVIYYISIGYDCMLENQKLWEIICYFSQYATAYCFIIKDIWIDIVNESDNFQIHKKGEWYKEETA